MRTDLCSRQGASDQAFLACVIGLAIESAICSKNHFYQRPQQDSNLRTRLRRPSAAGRRNAI